MAGLIKEPMNTVRRKEKSCPLSPRPSGPKPDCREAAPLAPETVRQLFDLTGKRIYDVYGLTENTVLTTCHPKSSRPAPSASPTNTGAKR
jgi:phenylacetate-coenzyme A ligase PaaK-like adenylate-forming protein